VLKPADVMEVEIYSDEEIAAWDKEDRLEALERDAILKNLRSALDLSVS
jgi:antitoxin PrlF